MNTQQLKDFYEMWKPLIESLPSVIQFSSQIDDISRHIDIKKAELSQVMEQKEKENDRIAALKLEADKIMDEANEKKGQIVSSAQDEVRAFHANASLEIAAKKLALQSTQIELEKSFADLEKAKAEHKDFIEKLEQERTAKKLEIEAEIKEIAGEHAKALLEFETFKAKIGV